MHTGKTGVKNDPPPQYFFQKIEYKTNTSLDFFQIGRLSIPFIIVDVDLFGK